MSARKTKKIAIKDRYAYTIKDVTFGEFNVLNSANAWWLDRAKLDKLITAYKNGLDDPEARVYAGISRFNYNYFLEKHPEFSTIKEDCQEVTNLVARNAITSQMKTDGNLAFKWMERKKPHEFGQKNNIGIAVQVNVGERMKEIKEKYSR